jgi:hypothetical protein
MDTIPHRPQGAPPSDLDGLLLVTEYQAKHQRIFPNIESLRWYIRQHRLELEGRGALLRIAGRLWVRPDPFDLCVLERGALAVQRPREQEAA